MTQHNHTTTGRKAREERQETAAAIREDSAAPAKQRIARLDARLGKGVGAVRERARLAAKLKAE